MPGRPEELVVEPVAALHLLKRRHDLADGLVLRLLVRGGMPLLVLRVRQRATDVRNTSAVVMAATPSPKVVATSPMLT